VWSRGDGVASDVAVAHWFHWGAAAGARLMGTPDGDGEGAGAADHHQGGGSRARAGVLAWRPGVVQRLPCRWDLTAVGAGVGRVQWGRTTSHAGATMCSAF